ncbi:translation initiation factor 2 [Lachnoanaerobaculum sp. MSX33]|uniref:translation initiation factor 2 n=1 Tax=Lachnoanaerobaculum sp. MSX33 TaxID=936596 RepID=UPI002E8E0D59|nr:translation initiation factor 2 [Lachnoanaerobaculum sp. MSX33]
MIREAVNNPSGASVDLVCDKKCFVLDGTLWKEQLTAVSNSIVFIDEGNEFIKTIEFSKFIQNTDNYYVIVTRESLPTLPYSVEEIYGIKSSGKYGKLEQKFNEFYRIYGSDIYKQSIHPDTVLTEDSNSGYQFFKSICDDTHIKCESLNGKSNIFQYLNSHDNENILVIVDGAAFGSEMHRVTELIRDKKGVAIYLPESFEWLVLLSGVVKNSMLNSILERPADYIESKEYFSWERFFTAILIDMTKDSYLAYTKKKLNSVYLTDTVKKSILDEIKYIKL